MTANMWNEMLRISMKMKVFAETNSNIRNFMALVIWWSVSRL